MNNKKSYQKQKEKGRIFRRLFRAYKETSTIDKVAGSAALGILFIALIFNAGNNPGWAILGFAAVVLVLNLIVYKANLLLSALVLAAHIAILPPISGIYSFLKPGEYNGDLVSPMIVLIAATVFFTLLAYRMCRGRYWVSLLVILFALDFGGLFLSATFELAWGTLPALIIAFLAFVIRCLPWRSFLSKGNNYIPPDLANSSQDDKSLKLFKQLGYNVVSVKEEWPISHIAYSKKRVFLIATLTPKKSLAINKDRFYYDGGFIEPMLYEIVKASESWSIKNKIEAKNITTVAIIHDSEMFPTADTKLSVQIAEKGRKNNPGQMYLVTQEGVKEISDATVPNFAYKAYQKLEKDFPSE